MPSLPFTKMALAGLVVLLLLAGGTWWLAYPSLAQGDNPLPAQAGPPTTNEMQILLAAAGIEDAEGSAVHAGPDATPGELAAWMAAKTLLLDVAFYTIALPLMIR
jgi:hypothetical protein